jgi:hypothetical protein
MAKLHKNAYRRIRLLQANHTISAMARKERYKQQTNREMKSENGSHEEKSSGSRPKAKPSVRTYRELQRQLRKDLLAQHPEWIEADGNSPIRDEYERRLARLISIFKSRSKTTSGQKDDPKRKEQNSYGVNR